MRLTTTTPVISFNRAKADVQAPKGYEGSYMSRERKGKMSGAYGNIGTLFPSSFSRTQRTLTPLQLWQVYFKTPEIRACVDSIVRRVATFNWEVKVDLPPEDKKQEKLLAEAKEIQHFLQNPTADGFCWQEILTATLTDLLVFEAGVLEIVESKIGKVAEIRPLRGCEVYPRSDVYGTITGYVQDPMSDGAGPIAASSAVPKGKTTSTGPNSVSSDQGHLVEFQTQDIVYLSLFPNTTSPLGIPLIETLVNEAAAILLSSDMVAASLDGDEVPPGLLVLGGLAAESAEEAKAELKSMRGKDRKLRMVTSPTLGGVDAKWVEFRKTNREQLVSELVEQIRRTIWRVFGVQPVEMGATQDVPRAVGQVQVEVGRSHLLQPILELIEAKINTKILPRLTKNNKVLKFAFDMEAKQTPDEEQKVASAVSTSVRDGIMTVNEARQRLKLRPLGPEGDIPMVFTSMGPYPLVEFVTRKLEAPKPQPDPSNPDPEDPEDPKDPKENPKPPPPEENPDTGKISDNAKNRALSFEVVPKGSLMDLNQASRAWPEMSRFEDVKGRILNLEKLDGAIQDYDASVVSDYYDCSKDIREAIRDAYEPNALSPKKAELLKKRISATCDGFISRWRHGTTPFYERAADIGEAFAFGRTDIRGRPSKIASDYQNEAMGYAAQFVSELASVMHSLVDKITSPGEARGKAPDVYLQPSTNAVLANITAGMEEAKLLSGVDNIFGNFEYRIQLYSGKLVEVANNAAHENFVAASSDEMCEWVTTGTGKSCPQCAFQASLGFQKVVDLSYRPGSYQTLCNAHCRCVLVYWTKAEVETGTAVRLG